MRRIRYSVATSLDGYIAGPGGEFDWIIMDPEIDFRQLMEQFDTILIGRRSFRPATASAEVHGMFPDMKTFVVSRTLHQRDYPDVTIISQNVAETVGDLRRQPGKDIWLFGGGSLFRSLAQMGLVDTVEMAVMPILLGGGIPLYPPTAARVPLKLTGHRLYASSGIISLEYAVIGGPN
jgi:dihydrofolate reductase